jgi:hypothetical protein
MDNLPEIGPYQRLASLLFIVVPSFFFGRHIGPIGAIISVVFGIGWFHVWRHIGRKRNWNYSFLYGQDVWRYPKDEPVFRYSEHPLLAINLALLLLYASTYLLMSSQKYGFVPTTLGTVFLGFWITDLVNKPNDNDTRARER